MLCKTRPLRGLTSHSHSSRFNVRVLCSFISTVPTKYQHSKLQTTWQTCRHCWSTLSKTMVQSLPNFAPPCTISHTSQPSLYPPNRFFKVIVSPEKTTAPTAVSVLRQISINTNTQSVAFCRLSLKPFSPLAVDIEPKHKNTQCQTLCRIYHGQDGSWVVKTEYQQGFHGPEGEHIRKR